MNDFFYDVLETISNWTPKSNYPTEHKYRDDLITFLRKTINSEPLPPQSAIWGIEHSGHHFIKKESGRSLADIGIDDEIGIELTRNLRHKSQINRLVGQVVDYLSGYSSVIIVLCGTATPVSVDILKHNLKRVLKSFSTPSGQEKYVTLMFKCKFQKARRR